jgi:hypothetical protein
MKALVYSGIGTLNNDDVANIGFGPHDQLSNMIWGSTSELKGGSEISICNFQCWMRLSILFENQKQLRIL